MSRLDFLKQRSVFSGERAFWPGRSGERTWVLRGGGPFALLLCLSLIGFTGCSDDDPDLIVADATEDTFVEYNEAFRVRYEAAARSNCPDGRTVFGSDDLADFSDIVAIGRVTDIQAATTPLQFTVDGAGGDTCNGTISPGIDITIEPDATLMRASDTGGSTSGDEEASDQFVLRITNEELDSVWDSTIVIENDSIDWLGNRQIFEGDTIALSAIYIEEFDVFSLAGHPFAFVDGDRIAGTSRSAYRFGCSDYAYADELYEGPLEEFGTEVSALVSGQDPDTSSSLYSERQTIAEDEFIPATALCFVSPR